MKNEEWRKNNEVENVLREPKLLLHFPFSIFISLCLCAFVA